MQINQKISLNPTFVPSLLRALTRKQQRRPAGSYCTESGASPTSAAASAREDGSGGVRRSLHTLAGKMAEDGAGRAFALGDARVVYH